MANKFISFLKAAGHAVEVTFEFAVKELPLASVLASAIFPPAVAPLAEATIVANLLQQTVLLVEKQVAAASNVTGATKLATVLSITQAAVTSLLSQPTISSELAKAHITVDTTYISNLVSAVVGILNTKAPTTIAVA